MRNTFKLGLALAVAVSAPATASAQITVYPIEYGIDAGIAFGLGDEDYTVVGIPAQQIRVGFFRSPNISIEPYGGLTYFDRGDDDRTNLTIGTGLLYHLAPPRTASALYVRPFVDLNYVSGGDESDTRFGVGAGLGLKMPWRDRFGTRLEANLSYRTDPGETVLGLLAGLSFYTR